MIALHRRASRRLRGRADLQGAADRPVDLSRPRRPAAPSRRQRRRASSATSCCSGEIRRVCEENFQVYGVRKVWRQLAPRRARGGPLHGGAADATMGSAGRGARQAVCARRSATQPRRARSTRSTGSSERRGRTSCGSRTSPTSRPGRASSTSPSSSTSSPGASSAGGSAASAHADFVLDALEQALHDRARLRRRPGPPQRSRRAVRLDPLHRAAGRGRHRALGRQRRRQLRQRPGRDDQRALQGRGDPSARALAPLEAVEYATLEWVDWFNNRRLLEPIGYIPPAEAEAAYYASLEEPAKLAA